MENSTNCGIHDRVRLVSWNTGPSSVRAPAAFFYNPLTNPQITVARCTLSAFPNGTVGTRPAACISFTQAADRFQIFAVRLIVSYRCIAGDGPSPLLGELAHFLFD